MKLTGQVFRNWPVLAWRIHWNGDPDDKIFLDHGAGVEVREDRFFEGAWNGDFSAGRFELASAMSGSGGICEDDELRLVPPFHPQERLYSFCSGKDGLWASNSLALLLASIDDEPDPKHSDYYFDLLHCLRQGRLNPNTDYPSLAFRLGSKITLHEIDHSVFGRDLRPQRRARPEDYIEEDFTAYTDFLRKQLASLIRNARDTGRVRSFAAVSAVSRGFDAVAVAAMAANAGVREAYTFLGDEDARPVAAQLGLHCSAWNDSDLEKVEPEILKLFFTIPIGQNRLMALAEPSVAGRLVLMGHGGDDLWGIPVNIRGRRLYRPFDSILVGNSYAEFRLKAGFIACPVPLIGAENNRVIERISRSAEMQAWAQPGSYNRPIARRIAEEAGVDRASFGQEKIKGEMRRPHLMTSGLREDFLHYCQQQGIKHKDQAPNLLFRLAGHLHQKWCNWVRIIPGAERIFGPSCTLYLRDKVHRYAGKAELFTFHWANDSVIAAYRKLLPVRAGKDQETGDSPTGQPGIPQSG